MRRWSMVAAALVAAAFATDALAAGPFRIADVSQDAVAIQDLGSKILVSGNVVQVQETSLYEQPQSGYDERRTLREFDCEKRAVRTKVVVAYRAGRPVAQAADAGWSA